MNDLKQDPPSGSLTTVELVYRDAATQPLRSIVMTRERVRIGRRFENDLILAHASVSRYHAELLFENNRWFIVDLESKFGTSLNGERVVRAELEPGDEVRLGGEEGPLVIFRPGAGTVADPASLENFATTDTAIRVADAVTPEAGEPIALPADDAMRLVEEFRSTSLVGDYDVALSLVLNAALELTRFETAALLLVDIGPSSGHSVRAEVTRSRPGMNTGAKLDAILPLALSVALSGRSAAIAEGRLVEHSGESFDDDAAEAAGIRNAILIPLAVAGRPEPIETDPQRHVAGAILVVVSGGPAPPLTAGVRTTLESLAGEASRVVERLYANQRAVAQERARQAATTAVQEARAVDVSLSMAERAEAACDVAVFLLLTGEPERAQAALESFDDAEARAQLPDATRARVLSTRGHTLMWQAKWHNAIGAFNAALDAVADGQSLQLEMAIRSQVGRCYAEIGELGLAREHVMTAVSALRRADDASTDYARALMVLGVIGHIDGDYTSALHAFRHALRVAERCGDLLTEAASYFRLGQLDVVRGDVTEAVSWFQRALEIAQPLGNGPMLALGHAWLAQALLRAGAWSRLESVIAAGLDIARSSHREDAERELLLVLTTLSVARGSTKRAGDHLASLRDFATAHDDVSLQLETDLLEAEFAVASNDLDRARIVLARAVTRSDELGRPRDIARVRLSVADVDRLAGLVDSAEARVGEAREAVERTNDLAVAGLTQRALGRLHADRGRFTEAQHSLAQSLSMFLTVGDRRLIGLVHLDLGQLMIAAGDPACARTHLQLASDIFGELGIPEQLASARSGLKTAIASGGVSSAASYSSIVLGSRSEPRFVRRLLEAAQTRELLFRELAAIALDVSGAPAAAAIEWGADTSTGILASAGDNVSEAIATMDMTAATRGETIRQDQLTVYPIDKVDDSVSPQPATVLAVWSHVNPGSRADTTLQIVVQLARQGLELVGMRASLKRAEGAASGLLREIQSEPNGQGDLLFGSSAAMRLLADRLQRIQMSSATVLITGESGVGKELVAQCVHASGPRRRAPFIPFNCSAAPRDLIESLLFGHRKGSFTGATADHEGLARAAAKGTLFLDEIGDLPLDLQPKLLRFLESGEIQPLGANKPMRVDVRLVAATNADLDRLVADRQFREDLYHRLNIIRLDVPPLRDRSEDIPLLVAHFLARASERAGRLRAPEISAEALAALTAYSWPGNVRHLRNEIERVVTFCGEGEVVGIDYLSAEVLAGFNDSPASNLAKGDAANLPDRLRKLEVDEIRRALDSSENNLTRAASMLGMARQNLQRRIKKLGLRVPGA